jgi:hypothetical protein
MTNRLFLLVNKSEQEKGQWEGKGRKNDGFVDCECLFECRFAGVWQVGRQTKERKGEEQQTRELQQNVRRTCIFIFQLDSLTHCLVFESKNITVYTHTVHPLDTVKTL